MQTSLSCGVQVMLRAILIVCDYVISLFISAFWCMTFFSNRVLSFSLDNEPENVLFTMALYFIQGKKNSGSKALQYARLLG